MTIQQFPTHPQALSPTRLKVGSYYITIGLEIHASLQTKTKLMSPALNSFSSSSFAPLDAGLPGVMPVLCMDAVEQAVAFGLAFGCEIPSMSAFDRKHYFYSDLSIGYQITQQFKPIVIGGTVDIDMEVAETKTQPAHRYSKQIAIEHAHLECDAAKSLHDKFAHFTAIDLSRGGSTLLEIVSTPTMYSPDEAVAYAQTIYEAVVAMGICDGKLEEGSFRMDASISLSTHPVELGTRVEIKNLSSFAYMRQALLYEMSRQRELLDIGKKISMDTVLYDEDAGETRPMRSKESVADYRYMPDPDIPAIYIDKAFCDKMSSLYMTDYFVIKSKLTKWLTELDIKYTSSSIFEALSSSTQSLWLEALESKEIIAMPTQAQSAFVRTLMYSVPDIYKSVGVLPTLADLLFISASSLTSSDTKSVLLSYLTSSTQTNKSKIKSLKDCMPTFVSAGEIETVIKSVLAQYPAQVADYKAGQEKLLQFLTGKCMAQLKGKASAAETQRLLKELIG